MSRDLRRGYTTGVHASFAFRSALDTFVATNRQSISYTNKMDNSDLDITKGCEIVVSISNRLDDLKLNPIQHKPHIIDNLSLYAGIGVGVVTKNGLKISKDYPAINPTPLKSIEGIYRKFGQNRIIFSTISVTDGNQLTKFTANSKVGVEGGISILGTTGFVKPISSSAYINSIRVELNFIKANGYREAILTLGNSSLEYAKRYYSKEQIVEVGNFVYDSFKIAQELNITKVLFIAGIGKMVKIYQGYKNTHNRFGSIDFNWLKRDIKKSLGVEIDIQTTKTVKGLSMQLEKLNLKDKLYTLIEEMAKMQIDRWFPQIDIEIRILK